MTIGLRVDSDQLRQLGDGCQQRAAEVEAGLQQLAAALSPLLGGDWAGVAKEQFHQLYDQWQASARQVRESLDGLGLLMKGAAENYAQAEAANARMFIR